MRAEPCFSRSIETDPSLRTGRTQLNRYVARYRAELLAEFEGPGGVGVAFARKHASIADELVRSIFEQVRLICAEVPLLLGAVGGYGRGLLAFGSDLDLCFVSTEPNSTVSECIETMLYPLWDAGINVGHQIVHPYNVAIDAAADLAMATELLDFRPLAGDLRLLPLLRKQLDESIFSDRKLATFIAQLEAGTKRRHEQFGDSVYLLEPDLKNGTGGLRDLDSALWAARARFGTNDLGEFAQLSFITAQNQKDTERALDFLWTIRNHLHRASGRKADRLTFTEQERIAEKMGYALKDAAGLPQLQRIGEMVEAFMSDYYRHARVIAQTSARIVGRAKRGACGSTPKVVPLPGGIVECEGRLGLAEPERIRRDPVLAFRIYALAVAQDMSVLSRTRDAIALMTTDPELCEQLRQDKEAAALFVALLCSSKPAPFLTDSILTELHDVGLLLAMIPEFAPVVGRVHHDMYHVYTVDVHSIAAVDKLHALTRGDLATTYPLAARLAAETVRRRVLFMATLLHDVGKAIGGTNHARRGAEMSDVILARLGFTCEESEDVSRLIRHHLTMYMVATRRDLNDPATITEFLRDTWDRESLRDLFLLTVADVSTTSTNAMTTWKLGMLNALFRSSDAFLAGSLAGLSSRVARVRDAVCSLWEEPASLAELEHFLDSMPERYFLANTPQEVVAHARQALGGGDESVSVSLMPSSHDGILGLCVVAGAKRDLDLCVVTDDRPGLLASIAAAISASRFDIQAAQINSRRLASGGYQALDLFWVRSSAHDDARERRLGQLKRNLAAVVRGEVAPEVLVEPSLASGRNARRPTPAVVTEVLFDHHASEEYTVIEVLAEDRPALLFTLSSTLRELGIVIGVAKISTEGNRAVDVLYAAESNGVKIQPGTRSDEVRAKLLGALGVGPAITENTLAPDSSTVRVTAAARDSLAARDSAVA